MVAFRPFGKRFSSRVTQGVFYIAWLSMVARIFEKGDRWLHISMPLMLRSFFLVGGLITFTDREGLVDFFGPDTKAGRDLSDLMKANSLIRGMRVLGILFMTFMLYLGFEMFGHKLVSLLWITRR
jgi:hypothetical protein